MYSKEEAKKRVSVLIEEYYQKYKNIDEANTETKLVEPLFEVLGWAKDDFVKREKARREGKKGIADYSFKIEDKIVFFLEVKRVGVPLDKEADKQVISYALSKRVPFAISTNFEQMKIFCVEEGDEKKRVFRVFSEPEEYLNKLQDLLLLTKESFKQDLLLKEAIKEERLKKRISIDKPLLEDLMHIRKLISDDLEKRYSGKYNINEKDEIIQRIIDRLIFIRRCEDIGINPQDIKLEELRHLPQNKTYPRLKEIFSKYNVVYNGGLFKPDKDNDCDVIDINGKIIQDLAYLLYESKDQKYIYNFDWIDADVLGQVYEQYLGKILQQTRSGKAKLKEGQAHRKEQGIYYTPTYIVDYIVKNTVGELLKDKKVKAENIKILDPACGSGSFLIKAFDYLYDSLKDSKHSEQYRFDRQGIYSIKTEILKNNLFGVDLDNKAVEITKLNLLLKGAEKNRKLPQELDLHIKGGNSLIDDESIAGLNAFKWTGDFQEESFDVVIGNPPYIRNTELPEEDKLFYVNKYISAYKQYDILILFIERSLHLLRNGGYLGFIVSNKFIASDYGDKLREFILKNAKIISLVDVSHLRVFKEASTYPVIVLLQKEDKESLRNSHLAKFLGVQDADNIFSNMKSVKIKQSNLIREDDNRFLEDKGNEKGLLMRKIESDTSRLGDICLCQRGSPKNKIKIIKESSKSSLKCVYSKDVGRYSLKISKEDFVVSNLQEKILSLPKILMPRTVLNLKTSLDVGGHFIMDRIYFFIPKAQIKIDLKYLVGILNSKLLDFYYKSNFGATHVGGGYLDLRGVQLVKIPIKQVSEPQQQSIIKLVDKMLSLNKELNKLGDKNTSETAKLKQETEKTDKDIDEIVYKIYGITEEEKKIIEESLS